MRLCSVEFLLFQNFSKQKRKRLYRVMEMSFFFKLMETSSYYSTRVNVLFLTYDIALLDQDFFSQNATQYVVYLMNSNTKESQQCCFTRKIHRLLNRDIKICPLQTYFSHFITGLEFLFFASWSIGGLENEVSF